MRDWIAETAINAYSFLLPLSQIAVVVALFVLLPLALWRKTRGGAGVALHYVSYLFGLTTWLLGAAVTFTSFGWVGLIIGLFIAGVGVVPFGIIGAFFILNINSLGISLILMLAITYATRLVSAFIVIKSHP